MFYSLLRFQHFIESLYQAFISLIRVLLRFRFSSDLNRMKPDGNELFILANGPSLREDLSDFPEILNSQKLLCVNQFVLSEAYEQMRPANYILLDIGFFAERTIPRVEEVREMVIAAFISKTDWPVTLFAPAEARNSLLHKQLKESGKPFSFAFFNRTAVDGWKPVRHCLYRRQAGMPPPQNVLIGGIMTAIGVGYTRLIILGADHSWHQGLEVGEDGILKSAENHFYDRQPWKVAVHHPETLQRAYIHDYFHNLHRTFRSYHLIREYADSRDITIINASRVTFIDAFERRPLAGYPWDNL